MKWISGLLFGMVLVALGLIIGLSRDNAKLIRNRTLERAQLEFKLSKWIYSHSERISKNTCEEIAREVAKTTQPALLLSLIELESIKFTPGALSAKGAIGWCQVMFDEKGKDVHGQELIKAGIIKEKRDLWDTACNIKAGAFILDMKLKKSKGNIQETLIAYNGGRDANTPAYLLRVLSNFAELSVN